MTRALIITGTVAFVTWLTWGPTIARAIRRHKNQAGRLLVPVLIFVGMFALSAGASVSFFITVPVLVAGLVLAANWPWPLDRQRKRNAPPAHHPYYRSRRRVPGCDDCTLTNTPPCAGHRRQAQALESLRWATPDCPAELTAIAGLLDDETSLAQASAAEQEARQAADPSNEGNHS